MLMSSTGLISRALTLVSLLLMAYLINTLSVFDLKKLAVPPLLWALAPKHRADIVQLLHAGTLIQAVFDIRADHASRVLRTQCQRSSVIVEGVHLLSDDVGFRAHAAGEENGLFQYWSADFVVVVRLKNGARRRFHPVPNIGGWRQ